MSYEDIIGREIQDGDYIVYYSNIYQVIERIPCVYTGGTELKILLVDKSKTTKPFKKYSRDMCLLNKDDVLVWKLKRGH